jgi:transposase InsO family protein
MGSRLESCPPLLHPILLRRARRDQIDAIPSLATLCAQLGVTQSLGGVGSSADNTLAEAFNATLKRETLAGAAAYTDATSCRREIFRWAVRYNTRRRLSYLAGNR